MTVAMPAFEPDVSLWDAWSPDRVASALSEVDAPWYVAGGWALDLFLGEQHREHADLEIAVPTDRFTDIEHALGELEFFLLTGPGAAMPLEEDRSRLAETHQTWARERATGLWRLDVFRESSDGDTWTYRRDARVRMPSEGVIEHTAEGIPYSRPEIVLLYKAKHASEVKHRDDFDAVLPSLGPERRGWLADALAIAHPDHPWIEVLRGAGT